MYVLLFGLNSRGEIGVCGYPKSKLEKTIIGTAFSKRWCKRLKLVLPPGTGVKIHKERGKDWRTSGLTLDTAHYLQQPQPIGIMVEIRFENIEEKYFFEELLVHNEWFFGFQQWNCLRQKNYIEILHYYFGQLYGWFRGLPMMKNITTRWHQLTTTHFQPFLLQIDRVEVCEDRNDSPPLIKIVAFDIECVRLGSREFFVNPFLADDRINVISWAIFEYRNNVMENIKTASVSLCDTAATTTPHISNHTQNNICCKTEKEMLLRFFNAISDVPFIVGWNTCGFDAPFLLVKADMLLGERMYAMLATRCSIKNMYNYCRWGDYTNKPINFALPHQEHIDVMLMKKKFMFLKCNNKLDSVAEALGLGNKLPNSLQQMEEDWYRRSVDTFEHHINYCVQDSILTGRILGLQFGLLIQLMIMVNCNIEIFNNCKSRVEHIECIMASHGFRIRMPTPRKFSLLGNCANTISYLNRPTTIDDFEPKTYEGAVVWMDKPGIYSGRLTNIDVNSMYPNIIIHFNLTADGTTVFYSEQQLEHYKRFRDTRQTRELRLCNDRFILLIPTVAATQPNCMIDFMKYAIKLRAEIRAIKTTDAVLKRVYDSRQQALKICVNGLYGLLGDRFKTYGTYPNSSKPTSSVRNIFLAAATTTIGREIISKISKEISTISEGRLKTRYIDTDGIVLHDTVQPYVSSDEILAMAHCCCPPGITLAVDFVGEIFLIKTKKRYIFANEEHIKMNGVKQTDRFLLQEVKKILHSFVILLQRLFRTYNVTTFRSIKEHKKESKNDNSDSNNEDEHHELLRRQMLLRNSSEFERLQRDLVEQIEMMIKKIQFDFISLRSFINMSGIKYKNPTYIQKQLMFQRHTLGLVNNNFEYVEIIFERVRRFPTDRVVISREYYEATDSGHTFNVITPLSNIQHLNDLLYIVLDGRINGSKRSSCSNSITTLCPQRPPSYLRECLLLLHEIGGRHVVMSDKHVSPFAIVERCLFACEGFSQLCDYFNFFFKYKEKTFIRGTFIDSETFKIGSVVWTFSEWRSFRTKTPLLLTETDKAAVGDLERIVSEFVGEKISSSSNTNSTTIFKLPCLVEFPLGWRFYTAKEKQIFHFDNTQELLACIGEIVVEKTAMEH